MQGLPSMCTAMIAFVRGVMRFSTSAGSRVRLSSISASTGTARATMMEDMDAMKVYPGNDHLVPRADAERGQRRDQRGRPRGHGKGVLRPELLLDHLLQRLHLALERRILLVSVAEEPAVSQDFQDFFFFFFSDPFKARSGHLGASCSVKCSLK